MDITGDDAQSLQKIYCSNYWQTYAELLVHLLIKHNISYFTQSSVFQSASKYIIDNKTFLGNADSPHSFVI